MKTKLRRKMFEGVSLILGLMLLGLVSLAVSSPLAAQTGGGLGIGEGHGLEVGINLPAFQQLQADVEAGLYDRPCTAAEHDPTKWHTLVNIEAKCHYDHHHGDDPHYVADIFGEPGAWFQRPGQSISYPWQTFPIPMGMSKYSTAQEAGAIGKMENDLKHESYTWVVRRNQGCNTRSGTFCVKDFRVQFHGDLHSQGAATRYHSFSAEVRVCTDVNNVATCGIIRTGNWMDTGGLFVQDPNNDSGGAANCGIDAEIGNQLIYIPLPTDEQFFNMVDPLEAERCHPLLTPSMIESGPVNGVFTRSPKAQWWIHGGSDFRFQATVLDPIGNVYETSPGSGQIAPHIHCDINAPECDWNQSLFTLRLHYFVPLNSYFVQGYRSDTNVHMPLSAGRYIDRFGVLNPSCVEPGLDCVPIEYSNLTTGQGIGGWNHSQCDPCERIDYDISPAGEQWITWFYRSIGGYAPPPAPDPEPVEEPEPEPAPEGPAIYFQVDDATSGQINVNVNLIGVSNVYGVQVECTVNPQVLQGTALTKAEFNDNSSFVIDDGFSDDGVWRVAASRLAPNPAINGDALAMSLSYQVLSDGDGQLNCSALAVDANGRTIDLNVVNGSVIIAPEVPEEPVVTEEPEPQPDPDPGQTDPVTTGSIDGLARYQNRPDNAGIKVEIFAEASTILGTVDTTGTGEFSFGDLAIGEYQVRITAPQHIPALESLTISDGSTPAALDVQLQAGDIDGNGQINMDDILLIAANFGLATVAEIQNVDLNADGTINISDLSLTSGNLDLVSPLLDTAP